jgi:catechol 2,3-dioxygenase
MTDLSSGPTTVPDPQADRLSWGVIELQVTDIDRAAWFWTTALGLIERDHAAPGIALGTRNQTLFILHSGAEKPVAPSYTGMYHVAIGVRSQLDFSRILARLLHMNIQVGPTDHLMAKSLYLTDPDGLEIEITLETPERFGSFGDMSKGLILYDVDGRPHSGRGPLDVGAELDPAKGADLMAPLPDDTYIAHLHFKVPSIEPALKWFETLGFERHLTLEGWGFADMGAGKPNSHRLAMNIWSGPYRPAAPKNMARLVHYELIAHDPDVLNRVQKNGADALEGQDPTGVYYTLRAA